MIETQPVTRMTIKLQLSDSVVGIIEQPLESDFRQLVRWHAFEPLVDSVGREASWDILFQIDVV